MFTTVYVTTNYEDFLKVKEILEGEAYKIEIDEYVHYGVKNYIINSFEIEADEIRSLIIEIDLNN